MIARLSAELAIKPWQAEAAVKLIDEGNTIPFIARYRKEATGELSDETLRKLWERLSYLRSLEERKDAILRSIEELGLLTPELKEQIRQAETLVEAEDLYRPYRPKRKTRGTAAREKGLEPLARDILHHRISGSVEQAAADYVNPKKGVDSPEAAIDGAVDILAEVIADDAAYRRYIRSRTWSGGLLTVTGKTEDETSVYKNYFGFSSGLGKVSGYQTLAINRGEKEKCLSVKIEAPKEDILRWLGVRLKTDRPVTGPVLARAAAEGYSRLIAPAVERELRNELTEKAEEGAIEVFGKNLRHLLMQPPIAGRVVLGWDPAFRTGCKLAVVDATGKVLDSGVIYPTAPTDPQKIARAKETLKKWIEAYHISLISLGNGTASRESEQVISAFLKETGLPVQYVITNEAGASVYSASPLASEEFPHLDVGGRSAVSIARRLQNPMAELVKIDPRSMGVGQYQHDMNQKRLGEKLAGVVEDCVNQVGVDLNTASASLLAYVSGITKTVAENIVAYRDANGRFCSRRELLKVAKLGPRTYEQCAGFLRISDGRHPLDATSVHPESYETAKKLLALAGYTPEDVAGRRVKDLSCRIKEQAGSHAAAAEKLGVGEPTLKDIIEALEKPFHDPREDMPRPILRADVLEMKDLKAGMVLKGTVRNVMDFGAFVDIGVHQDGLVHISRMAKGFVRHPLDVVSVGDVVQVRVVDVDMERKRIGLSMITEECAAQTL